MNARGFHIAEPVRCRMATNAAMYVITAVLSLDSGQYNICATTVDRNIISQNANVDNRFNVAADKYTSTILNSDFASKYAAMAKLDHLFAGLQHEGWDGYSAYPLEKKSYDNTKKVIELLTGAQLSHWNIFPSPNGTFLLSAKSNDIASISVGNSEFSFAAMKGETRLMGKEPFDARRVAQVVEHIHSILGYV